MGKLFCVIDESGKYGSLVVRAVREWAEDTGEICFSDKGKDDDYNLYINNYIIETDFEVYCRLSEKYRDKAEGILLDTEEKYGFLKFYDTKDIKSCIESIVSEEFLDYKNPEYDFSKYKLSEEKPEDIHKESDTLQMENTGDVKNAKKKKNSIIYKIVIPVTAVFILAAFVLTGVLILSRNREEIREGIGFLLVGDNIAIASSKKFYGEFDIERSKKSLDGTKAAVLCLEREGKYGSRKSLYFADSERFEEIDQGEIVSFGISDSGEYIFYIKREVVKCFLCKYDTARNKITKKDISSIIGVSNYGEVHVSPNGDYAVVHFIGEEETPTTILIDSRDNIELYKNLGNIIALRDDGKIYCNQSGFDVSIADKSGVKSVFTADSFYPVSIYLNSDYKEMLIFNQNRVFLYSGHKDELTRIGTAEGSPILEQNISFNFVSGAEVIGVKNFEGIVFYERVSGSMPLYNLYIIKNGKLENLLSESAEVPMYLCGNTLYSFGNYGDVYKVDIKNKEKTELFSIPGAYAIDFTQKGIYFSSYLGDIIYKDYMGNEKTVYESVNGQNTISERYKVDPISNECYFLNTEEEHYANEYAGLAGELYYSLDGSECKKILDLREVERNMSDKIESAQLFKEKNGIYLVVDFSEGDYQIYYLDGDSAKLLN